MIRIMWVANFHFSSNPCKFLDNTSKFCFFGFIQSFFSLCFLSFYRKLITKTENLSFTDVSKIRMWQLLSLVVIELLKKEILSSVGNLEYLKKWSLKPHLVGDQATRTMIRVMWAARLNRHQVILDNFPYNISKIMIFQFSGVFSFFQEIENEPKNWILINEHHSQKQKLRRQSNEKAY